MKKATSKKYIKPQRIPFLKGEDVAHWDADLVIASILELNSEVPLTTLKMMGVNRAPKADPILTAFNGKPTSRKFIHYAGSHFFGSWNGALKASGLYPIISSYNKFWSKTLILKCIKALYENGHPLTVKTIWRDRSRKTSRILKEVSGKATTGSALHDAARRYLGSWDAALKKAGVNPDAVKEKPFWTKKKIVNSLKHLHQKGIPLNSESIGRDKSRSTASLIKEELGKKRLGRSLYGGAYRIFGSWDRALIEAGINPDAQRKRKFFWNTRQLSRLLRVLYELNIPVNSSSIAKDSSEQTANIIFDYTGQPQTGSFIYKLGTQKLGTWDATLKSSGFWLSEIRRSGYPCEQNEEKIIEIIRTIHQHEIPLNRSAVYSRSNQVKFLIESKFGPPVSGSSLMATAEKVFGSWDQALWEAGLDVSEIRLKSRPNSSNLPLISTQVEASTESGEYRKTAYLGETAKTPEEVLEAQEAADSLESVIDEIDDRDTKDLTNKIFDAVLNIHHYKDQNQLIKFIIQELNYEVTELQVKNVFSNLANKLTQKSFSQL